MRKLFVASSLALVLAACGGGGDQTETKTPETNVEKPKSDLGAALKDSAAKAGDAVKDVAGDVADAGSDVADSAGDLASDVTASAEDMLDDAKASAGEMVDDAKAAAGDMVDDAKAAAGDMVDSVTASAEDTAMQAKLAALPAPYNTADLEKGKKMFRQCATCHLVDDSGKHRVGPNLHGVVGKAAAQADGFNYSPAMKESGVIWTPEAISEYIERPNAYIKGNRMSFAGLKKESDRINVIAYIMVNGGLVVEE